MITIPPWARAVASFHLEEFREKINGAACIAHFKLSRVPTC